MYPHPEPDETNDYAHVQDESSPIPSLTDDCLLEIFSMVSAFDLSVIKRCSRRLSDFAEFAARIKYRFAVFEYRTSIGHGSTHRKYAGALRDFGIHVHHIRIDMDCFCKNYDRAHFETADFGHCVCSGERMLLELEQCTNLRSLTLVRMQLHNVSTRKVSKALRNLIHVDTLHLVECAGIESNIGRLINSFRSLKNLTILAEPMFKWTAVITDHMLKHISELETIESISFATAGLQETLIENIKELRRLRKLKKFKLDCGNSHGLDFATAVRVLTSIASLKELIFTDLLFSDAVRAAVDQLTHLKPSIEIIAGDYVDLTLHVID